MDPKLEDIALYPAKETVSKPARLSIPAEPKTFGKSTDQAPHIPKGPRPPKATIETSERNAPMEELTSKTIAVFSRPFTVPGFTEMLPAGEYEIETELSSPPDQVDPEAWKASVFVRLHPRISHPGLERFLTVSLVDLDQARARDKLTGKELTDFFVEEMLADPMIRLVMKADGVSEAHLRNLYSRPGSQEADKKQIGQVAPSEPRDIQDGTDAQTSGTISKSPCPGMGE